MITLKPLQEKILVVRLATKSSEITKNGIIIPGLENQKSNEARVVALGSGKKSSSGSIIPFDVKIGDIVLLNKFSGVEVQVGSKQFVLVKEEDILGILSN